MSKLERETFNAAVNLLAVEYLVKTKDNEKYGQLIEQLYALDSQDWSDLNIELSLNMHIRNLGEMISQGDYDDQLHNLLEFLISKRKGNNHEQ